MTILRAVGTLVPLRANSLIRSLSSSLCSRAPWTLLLGALALGGIVVLLAYGRSLSVGFLGDDFNILEQLGSDGPFSRWSSRGQPFFRPFVVWSYFLELRLWGLNPWAFHLVNLLMHLAAGVGVALFAQQLTARFTTWQKRQRWEVGGGAGLLFLCHPSHVEPVVWVSCRGDLQAAVFGLVCLLCHGRWVALQERMLGPAKKEISGQEGAAKELSKAGQRGRLRRWRVLSLVALALALGSKESAATLPVAVLALEWMARSGSLTRRLFASLKAAAPLLAMLPVYLVVRTLVLGTLVGGYGTRVHLRMDPVQTLDRLFVEFSRALIPMISGHQVPEGAVAILLGCLAVWALRRRARFASGDHGGQRMGNLVPLCLVLFAIAAFPTLGMKISQHSTLAERLLYFPSTFAMILAAVLLQMSISGPGRRRWVLAGICIVFTTQTAWALEPWRQAKDAADTVLEPLLADDFKGTTYLLGVPDSIRGAYVYRNGLESALRLQGVTSRRVVLVHRVVLPKAGCEFVADRRKKIVTLESKDHCHGPP